MWWKKIYKILLPVSFVGRVVAPLAIFWYPLSATFAAFTLDWVDSGFYRQWGIRRLKYDFVDKSLDFYWYTVSLIYAFGHLPYLPLLVFLYVIRLVGQVAFYIRRDDGVFVYFPNMYENVFIFLLVTETFSSISYLAKGGNFVLIFIVLLIYQVIREFYLHGWGGKQGEYFPEWMKGPE